MHASKPEFNTGFCNLLNVFMGINTSPGWDACLSQVIPSSTLFFSFFCLVFCPKSIPIYVPSGLSTRKKKSISLESCNNTAVYQQNKTHRVDKRKKVKYSSVLSRSLLHEYTLKMHRAVANVF